MRNFEMPTRHVTRALAALIACAALLGCSSSSENASVAGTAVERTSSTEPGAVETITTLPIAGAPSGSFTAPDGRDFEITVEGAVLHYQAVVPAPSPSTTQAGTTTEVEVEAEVSVGSAFMVTRGVELLGAEMRDGGTLALRFACQQDDHDQVSAVSMLHTDDVLWVFGEVESEGGGNPCSESSELAVEVPIPADWATSREVKGSDKPL